MNIPVSSRGLRLVRRYSFRAFWLGPLALVFSGVVVLPPWLLPVVLRWPMFAVAMILVYLSALALGPPVARQEIAAALSGSGRSTRPIILFLRSVDPVEHGLLARAVRRCSRAVLGFIYFFFTPAQLVAGSIAETDGTDADPTLRFVLGIDRYAVEERLDEAIESRAIVVSIGNKRASHGPARLVVDDGDWHARFRRLTDAAMLIFILPGASSSALWDAALLVGSRSTLQKIVFVMPRDGSPSAWAALAQTTLGKIGARLPPYDPNGCFFRLGAEGPAETIPLETFVLRLGRRLAAHDAARALSFDELWRSTYAEEKRSRQAANPKTPADWAARVAITGFIEDAEELIRQLGGAVERGKGTRVSVRLSGEARAFANGYELVQWTLRELVPRVGTDAAPQTGDHP
jgi:hypothetical protein